MKLLFIFTLLLGFLDDGSLLYIKNGNKIVQKHTQSDLTHVAIIFNEDNAPYVYEAIKPVVRKIKLADYEKELAALNKKKKVDRDIILYQPKQKPKKEEIEGMKKYLNSQLGRKYSVNSYIFEQEQSTIHCAEIVSHTLHLGDKPYRETPISILTKTKASYVLAKEYTP